MVGVQCACCGSKKDVHFYDAETTDVADRRLVKWNIKCEDCGAEGEVLEIWKKGKYDG